MMAVTMIWFGRGRDAAVADPYAEQGGVDPSAPVLTNKYRDPRPDEIQDDEGLWMKLLPPERQAYWRQILDDGFSTPRYNNYSATAIEADVRAYQNELLCSALQDMAEAACLLRETLEQAK